jgi:4,5-DOPA dioxygenase extradiol
MNAQSPERQPAGAATQPRRRILLSGAGLAVASAMSGMMGGAGAQAPASSPAPGTDGRPPAKERMPVLFIGHGSPMNAIADNAFTRMLTAWGRDLGRPAAILMVSAHWLTERQVQVSTTAQPETIHDFGGFPPELYKLQYPAPGAPAVARAAAQALAPRVAGNDASRGLDHGAWSVLRHMYPLADVPVFQLSIDITKAGSYHHAVGRALAPLRDAGVLIIGSGNVVHNLRATMRGQPDTLHGMTPWAEDFDVRSRAAIDDWDAKALMAYETLTPGAMTAVPFPDHYFPLLYAMGAAQSGESVRHVYEGFQAGTLSMRCVQWG